MDTSTGRLLNTASTNPATNVQIGLLNADMSNIQLGAGQAAQNSQRVAINNGSAVLNYFAQYVATTGAATSGAVNTSTLYTIVYQ